MPDSKRNGDRPEFEIAWYTKELGKELQREMLHKQLALLSEGGRASSIQPAARPVAPTGDTDATDSTPERPESSA